jgi:hypothetical protein
LDEGVSLRGDGVAGVGIDDKDATGEIDGMGREGDGGGKA